MDKLVRAITADGMVKAVAVTTRDLTERVRNIHKNHHADRMAVGTNRDERVQTSGRLSIKIDLRRKHTTTHGEVSRRWLPELKTVYKSVLEPSFQAQISGASSPHTKDCINAC